MKKWMVLQALVAQGALDCPGGGLHIGGLKQGGNDNDASRSGGEDLGQGYRGEATDAEGGDFLADLALHGGDFVEADGGAAGFGGGGEKRAEADVIEALGEGGAGLIQRMSGAADEFARTDDVPGFGERAVVLADVNAIRIDFRSEGGMIVKNERNSGGAAERKKLLPDTPNGGEIVTFRSKLEEISTASQERSGDFFRARLRDVAEVEDAVETRGVEMRHRMR
jgi:hypothetical protein